MLHTFKSSLKTGIFIVLTINVFSSKSENENYTGQSGVVLDSQSVGEWRFVGCEWMDKDGLEYG